MAKGTETMEKFCSFRKAAKNGVSAPLEDLFEDTDKVYPDAEDLVDGLVDGLADGLADGLVSDIEDEDGIEIPEGKVEIPDESHESRESLDSRAG